MKEEESGRENRGSVASWELPYMHVLPLQARRESSTVSCAAKRSSRAMTEAWL